MIQGGEQIQTKINWKKIPVLSFGNILYLQHCNYFIFVGRFVNWSFLKNANSSNRKKLCSTLLWTTLFNISWLWCTVFVSLVHFLVYLIIAASFLDLCIRFIQPKKTNKTKGGSRDILPRTPKKETDPSNYWAKFANFGVFSKLKS